MADQLREAVVVFGTEGSLKSAIDQLLTSGFNRADLSVLGADGLEAKLNRDDAVSTKDLADTPDAPREDYEAGETHGAAQGALVGGGGGAVGAVLASAVGKAHKDRYSEQLASGGVILWVRTPNADAEREATRILNAHGGSDVHIHEIPAG